MNQIIANPDNEYSNKYGFYALPKSISKFRSDSQLKNPQPGYKEFQALADEGQGEPYYFVDKTPYPQFVAKEKGRDKWTQIQDNDPHLFDFVTEVQPILEILVGQALDKAQNQLIEEYQRSESRRLRLEYQKKRAIQLMVTQRRQARHLRIVQQKQRRILQHQTFIKQKKISHRKIQARIFAKEILVGVRQQNLDHLERRGFLKYSLNTHINMEFMPWLLKTVASSVNEDQQIKKRVVELIESVEEQILKSHAKSISQENNRKSLILRQRQKQKRVNQERIRKRRERKKKLQINKRRSQLEEKIFSNVVAKGEHVDNFNKGQVGDSLLPRQKPLILVTGGFLIQLGKVLSVLKIQDQTSAEGYLLNLLGMLTSVELPLKESSLEVLKQLLEQQNNKDISQQKEQFIKNVLADILQTQIYNLLVQTGYVAPAKIKLIYKIFLDILLTSNYKPQVQAPQAEQPSQPVQPAAGQQSEVPSAQPQAAQIPNTEDNLRSKKIQVQSKIAPSPVNKQNIFKGVSNLLRMHFPLQKPQNEEQLNAKKELQLQALRQANPDFILDQYIQIFDGKGWENDKAQFPQALIPQNNKFIVINVGLLPQSKLILLDQVNNFALRRTLLGMHEQHQRAQEQSLLKAMRDSDNAFEALIMAELRKENEQMAIFDFEGSLDQ